MQIIAAKKVINVDQLPFPGFTKTLDTSGRVTQLVFVYKSVTAQYDATWIGETNTLDTYTQTITDNS